MTPEICSGTVARAVDAETAVHNTRDANKQRHNGFMKISFFRSLLSARKPDNTEGPILVSPFRKEGQHSDLKIAKKQARSIQRALSRTAGAAATYGLVGAYWKACLPAPWLVF
jgi:hypothetical protein